MNILKLDIIIQVLFICATSSVFLAANVPLLNQLLKYGKTLNNDKSESSKDTKTTNGSFSFKLINWLKSIYVPKHWFFHFYILSTFLSVSLFTLSFFPDFIVNKFAIKFLISDSVINNPISFKHFLLLSLFNLIQGIRRAHECIFVFVPSNKSNMHMSHYLVGIFFYTTINILPYLWFLPTQSDILESATTTTTTNLYPYSLSFSMYDLIAIYLFAVASADQSRNHGHLSTLKKYTKPFKGLFEYCCCAHYFDEIVIYLSHFIIFRRLPSFLAFVWVVSNLSVSANETYIYYLNSTDQNDRIQNNYWRIIPFLY